MGVFTYKEGSKKKIELQSLGEKKLATCISHDLNVGVWEYLDMFCSPTYSVLVSKQSTKPASEKDVASLLYPSKHSLLLVGRPR